MRVLAIFALVFLPAALLSAQTNSVSSQAHEAAGRHVSGVIPLNSSSTMNVASEIGGAFMLPSKCDEEGNLFIRKFATDRPLLGPVVRIDADGKRTALFDPAAFSQLGLDRADAFSPASDGGLYQIAQKGIVKPQIYVLHFSPDGSAGSAVLLDADLEVYTFAAFPIGNFLVSGVQRDLADSKDRGHNFTAVFSADGRMLARLSFERSKKRGQHAEAAGEVAPTLDLADAEVGVDGNLYVMRGSSPALVYVISPGGKILRTLEIAAPTKGPAPSAFHISGNQVAVSFWSGENESQILMVADAQSGRNISTYSDVVGAGPAFACYSANDGVFTFLKLGEGNTLQVIRAQPR